ncbi:SusC/RagA family TonB-linked outer membrane protein [Hymenobacter ruricola]|uniref:TonB-dependent receptor n=1 Tax=Hymenobacter ruricola TaxID=2791023 RepID=A0ABS0I2K6_9BACT|nr:TonB-dependent receptor [Hymenobacter ruricola]MBF9221168.1 TonB-dependent receptor [Hymenobacter ruricola]
MNTFYSWQRLRLAACVPLFLMTGPALAAAALPPAAARHAAADWQLTGKVTSPNGEGLPGVTIVVKGTTLGTSSNADGSFSLAVPETPGTLVFSFVGFQTQERPFAGPENFSIRLADDTKSLDEVVVVGYGTQKRSDVTGAIATLDASKLEERPITRVDQALVGQLAGVQVQQNTGLPGRGFTVQVRGNSSITAGNQPLYVIDGFPLEIASPNSNGNYSTGNPLDNINPSDIQSIEVLKDAAAAAIYGSRAANGVVLVTTKRGKTGKAVISVNAYSGVSQMAKKLDLLTPEEWTQRATEIVNAAWVKSGAGRSASQDNATRRQILGLAPGAYTPSLMPDDRWSQPGHPGLDYIDWQDAIFRTGVVQNYQVSASGATPNINYFVSGNFNDQQGIVIGVNYRRYSARANVEVKANDKLKFGLNLTPTYSESSDPGVEGKDNLTQKFVTMVPVAESSAGLLTNYGENPVYLWGGSSISPVGELTNRQQSTKTFRSLATVYGELEPVKNLRLRSTVNLDNTDARAKSYIPNSKLVGSGATGTFSGYRHITFVNENTATYSRVFAEKHDLTVLAGYSYNYFHTESDKLKSSGGFVNSAVTTLNGATNITGTADNGTSETQNTLVSQFARLQYAFMGKYLLMASVRRDGSSRFGEDSRWGVFPAGSAGWRISQEGFMKNVAFLSELKVRGSIGFAGNNNIGDYSSLATLGVNSYTFGGAIATGQAPNSSPNADLRWEKSRTLDFGLDYGFFRNRIFGSFDYYTKTSKDLLLSVPVPSASGYGSQLRNIGEVLNQGWEVELKTNNFTGAFTWSTALNFSHNENQVVHLGPGDAAIEIPSSYGAASAILQVGQPMFSFYSIVQDGILTQADIDSKVPIIQGETVGDPKYRDADNSGAIDDKDRVIVGQPSPKYTWGITNTFSYKGFDLSVLVQGQNGGQLYSLIGRAIDNTNMGYNQNVLGLQRDRWISPENPGAGERGKASTSFTPLKSTSWLYSSDYYRVRNITLGYNLNTLIGTRFVQAARVYASLENFFGHDTYRGGYNVDAVNSNAGGGSFGVGTDYGGLPLTKSVTFGLNVTF